jgi:hypothetical protein
MYLFLHTAATPNLKTARKRAHTVLTKDMLLAVHTGAGWGNLKETDNLEGRISK